MMRSRMAGEDELVKELREHGKWLRLLGLASLRPLLATTVASDRDRLIYELSDGTRSTRDIANLAGVSKMTVSRLWQDWLAIGLCTESKGTEGRAEHLVSLAKVGIAVPKQAQALAASPSEPIDQPLEADNERRERE